MAQIWLSLSMTMLLKSWRCGSTPPTIIPYFSTSLNPGVVLRVPAIVPFQPACLAASRNLRDLDRRYQCTTPARDGACRSPLTPTRSHYTVRGCSKLLSRRAVAVGLCLSRSLPLSLRCRG